MAPFGMLGSEIKQVENATLGAFTPKRRFHSSCNYWQKYPLFGVFILQELGLILVIGMLFGGNNFTVGSKPGQ